MQWAAIVTSEDFLIHLHKTLNNEAQGGACQPKDANRPRPA